MPDDPRIQEGKGGADGAAEKNTKDDPERHCWVGAINLPLDDKAASAAYYHRAIRVNVSVQVLEVYCSKCRKTYDDVGRQPCGAGAIGGPIGERKKRLTGGGRAGPEHPSRPQLLGPAGAPRPPTNTRQTGPGRQPYRRAQ